MASTSPPADQTKLQGLRRLGDGSSDDRLKMSLVVGILLRCVRLLKPVRWHLVGLFTGFTLAAILLVPLGLIFIDTLWTRILQGNPLSELEAGLFGIPLEIGTTAAGFTEEVRRELARTLIWFSATVAVFLIPFFLGLYYFQVWILQRVNQKLRVDLLSHLQSLSLRFHADNSVGDALYRLNQDTAMVTQLIQVLILTPVTAIPQFFFAALLVSAFSPKLALILILVLVPALICGGYFSKRLRVRFRRARETNSALTSRIQETLVGIKVIKAYGAEKLEQEMFEESSHEAFAAAFSSRNLYALFAVVCFWIFGSVILLLTALGTLETMEGTKLAATALGFTIWNLGLYNYFKARLGSATEKLKEIFRTWGRVQDVAIGLDRVFEVLDREPEVEDAEDATVLTGLRDGIRFEDVNFHYEADRPVLGGVSFEAKIGTITAIVGPTGSGKTTLMALLLRLFDPTGGEILIDGVDLKKLKVSSIRDQVSIALQENVLFGSSIRENIRFAVPDADDAAVRAAARVAAADGFISALPRGYDTPLGERGSKLSTGQRQRLSIARAVLKDTPILILDEPTAALDAATELEVLRNLAEWGRGRAIFLITHRLSTIRQADDIIYLEAGRVLETGSHQTLMEREQSPYRALVHAERTAARSLIDQVGAA